MCIWGSGSHKPRGTIQDVSHIVWENGTWQEEENKIPYRYKYKCWCRAPKLVNIKMKVLWWNIFFREEKLPNIYRMENCEIQNFDQ